jgi:RNA polymerase sigma-70 factor (ECF subfamily)
VIDIADTHTVASAADLIRLAAEGDHSAFATIVRRHHPELVRVGFVISGNADTADQAAAATWVICWRQLRGLRDPDRLRSWLCAITANEARQLVRKQRRRSVVEIPVENMVTHVSGDPAARPGDLDLANALARLSVEDRALVALRYVCGFNSTELGRAMGMSASGTRARLARLLDRLRKELGDE